MTKVLVVDDEIDIRDLLNDELTDSGFEVIEAENGAEALNRIYNDHPDIVLLDLNMPVLDGMQVLKTLKSNPFTSKLPVVLLTAVSADEGEQRSMELGANHYVTKPWEPGAIQTVIKVTLREVVQSESEGNGEWTADQPKNENEMEQKVGVGVASNQQNGPIEIISVADPELNANLGGGILLNGLTFIEGSSSTGKSVLCQHLAYTALTHGHGVSYFSSQYSPTTLVSQMASLGMNSSQYFRSGQLKVTAIPKVDPSVDCTDVLLELGVRIKETASSFRFVIIDVLTSVSGGSQESAVIGFLAQCKEMGIGGNSVIVAAHPGDMSGDTLNRIRTLSDSYLALQVEKSGNTFKTVLEVFKSGTDDYLSGKRVNFDVERGVGIQVEQPTRATRCIF